ncbi:L,D-transpeptidase [Streptomyces sp. A7024]|uniref:L,D-transpeptidase n=1 Tax=Streptomyces coryli TaxID=1128680 RepID=A0A6G4U787_9ACTN|nr:L,D-transpeptidase [Streptomyces coryli]NGN67576.1 L,D-transpeptidase [Streptomyces coryli]
MPPANDTSTGLPRTLSPLTKATITALSLLTLTGAATTQAAAAQQPRPSAQPACATDRTGPYQEELERYLGQWVDGVQTSLDCRAIQKFQLREGVQPANGYAGKSTYQMTVVAKARANPGVGTLCPVRRGRVACVDQKRQLMWVQKGKRVLVPPMPVRTGAKKLETRNGWHRVYYKKRKEYSRLYKNAPMPYSMYFSRGQAIHGTPNDIFRGRGSAGCVNLRIKDAKVMWRTLKIKDRVYIFGRKPAVKKHDL